MGKTVDQWQAGIISVKNADPTIGTGGPSELSSTSLVAVWRLWTRIVATAMFDLGNAFDVHKAEVQGIIAAGKAHTLQWYATKAKAFQFGATLPPDTDLYNPIAPAGDPSLIVTYAAAVEYSNLVRLKVATGSVGALAALSGPQLTAFTTYMNRIKDAGVRLQCTSGAGDNLQVKINVYYDPLILDATGARLDGTAATPVKDGINAFLNSLPFNGLFVFDSFIAALQAVDGVKIAEPLICQANYAATPYVNIMGAMPNDYTPDAGYLALDVAYFNANVNYIAMP